MPQLEIGPGESIHYEYDAPAAGDGKTVVFVNALTGSTGAWQASIGPALRAAGYGTLAWNFRGQQDSAFDPAGDLTPTMIVEDLARVVSHVNPPAPVLVGLSIGGLFAAQGIRAGVPAAGVVLINTLRKPGPRLEWINTAMVAMARAGGSRLIMEANLPMLVNPDQLVAMRPQMFPDAPYEAMDPANGLFKLMAGSLATDWDFPWETLDVPTLVMTGLHDRVFRIDADVAELTARLPNARTVTFEDAGHLIPIERPERFTEALLEFLSGL